MEISNFRKHTREMRSWFYKRDYPKVLVETKMGKVKFSGYNRRNKREKKGVPLCDHPSLKNIGRIINQNLYILYMNEDVKNVFTPAPMISFRSARKLSSYLVRAKLYPLERTVGSVQCKGKRCQTFNNVKETETFNSKPFWFFFDYPQNQLKNRSQFLGLYHFFSGQLIAYSYKQYLV